MIDWKTHEVNSTEAAKFLGISEQALGQWVKKGMPKIARGRYNLRAIVHWYLDEKLEGGKNIREELWKAQKEGVELQNEVIRGNLLPIEEVEHWATELAIILTSGLEALPARSAPEVISKTDIQEVQAVVDRECQSIRTAIMRHTESFTDKLKGSGDSKAPAKRNGRRLGRPKASVAPRKPRTRAMAVQ